MPGGTVRYPASYMQDFFSNIMYQTPIMRSTFPNAWLEAARETPPSTDTAAGGGYQQQQPSQNLRRGGGGGGSAGGLNLGYPFNTGYCQPIGTDLKHLHPIIKLALQEYHELVGDKHRFTSIIEKGRINWRSMPQFPASKNPYTGKDDMCWNYVTGACHWGERCHFKQCHFPGARFTDAFANDVIKAIKPGIDAIVREIKWGLTPPVIPVAPGTTPSDGLTGGPPNKKQRTGGR